MARSSGARRLTGAERHTSLPSAEHCAPLDLASAALISQTRGMYQPRSSAQKSTQRNTTSSNQVKPAKSKRQQSHTRKPAVQQADKHRKKAPEAAGRKVSATNHPIRPGSRPLPPATPTREVTTQNYRRSPPEKKGPLIFQGELRYVRSGVFQLPSFQTSTNCPAAQHKAALRAVQDSWYICIKSDCVVLFCSAGRFPTSNGAAGAWIQELLDLADSSPNPVVVGFDSETPVVWKNSPDGTSTMLHGQTVALLQLCYHPPTSNWVSASGMCRAAQGNSTRLQL